MSVSINELDRFHDFAVSLVSTAEADVTWLQLFELWQMENPTFAEYREDLAAIRESVTAMDAGRMQSLAEFDADFRARRGVANDE